MTTFQLVHNQWHFNV